MSFQQDKIQLQSSFDVLKQQIALTSENWDDTVQRRFYEQFINSLPKEFMAYINSLEKLDKSFERAEEQIGMLR